MSLEQALLWVRRRRPIISPNKGFMVQLQQFEKLLLDCDHRMMRTSFSR